MSDKPNILVETHGRVGLIRLNRPEALNALCDALMRELKAQLQTFDGDKAIGAIVITGNERAFAAGADIKEMRVRENPRPWSRTSSAPTGSGPDHQEARHRRRRRLRSRGGCELAMMCDMIIAADTAKFGQPEINLGVIPGAGGTQRLTRAVGKSKAMDMILTARMMDAVEAERANLVSACSRRTSCSRKR